MEIEQNIRLAVDAVVFGYQKDQLYILLVEQRYGPNQGKWVLPGGFVKNDEPLVEAVRRELMEEAGIQVNYLEQLHTFGDEIHRDPRFRVVSVAYFALVNPANFILKADTDAVDAKWFDIQNVPSVGYDHASIIQKGKERLIAHLSRQPIGFDLLDEEFPFSDLENLYMCILGRQIDRRNFRKKILSFGILDETDKFYKNIHGRPGKLFKFNRLKYSQLEKKGFHFEIDFV